MDTLRFAWFVFLGLGTILVVAALVGPLIEVPGYVSKSGPPAGVVFSSSVPDWTDAFGIPPVQAGQQLHIVASKTGPGNITIQIIGYGEGDTMPEAFTLNLDDAVPSIDANITVHRNAAYIFLVTSYDAKYSLVVSGVWGAYADLRVGLYWGVVLLISGGVALYYWRIKRGREKVIGKAMERAGPLDGPSQAP